MSGRLKLSDEDVPTDMTILLPVDINKRFSEVQKKQGLTDLETHWRSNSIDESRLEFEKLQKTLVSRFSPKSNQVFFEAL